MNDEITITAKSVKVDDRVRWHFVVNGGTFHNAVSTSTWASRSAAIKAGKREFGVDDDDDEPMGAALPFYSGVRDSRRKEVSSDDD